MNIPNDMKLTPKFFKELQRRLKAENNNSIYVNLFSAKKTYLDLSLLSSIQESYPEKFLEALFSLSSFSFIIDTSHSGIPKTKLAIIEDKFEKLQEKADDVLKEKGINTFGFGYPLIRIIEKKGTKKEKVFVTPVIIWTLEIENTENLNEWKITKQEDSPITINEVLINKIESKKKFKDRHHKKRILKEQVLNQENIKVECLNLLKRLKSLGDINIDLKEVIEKLETCNEIKKDDFYKTALNSFIHWGGIFSTFESQKQSLINEYDSIIKFEKELITQNVFSTTFQPLTPITTDPSQQRILNSLSTERNIIIQGPPGTGKSQTLTAIIVNALENKKRVMVVCEKDTALLVLKKNLEERKLDSLVLLIKNAEKDSAKVATRVEKILAEVRSKKVNLKYEKELKRQVSRAEKIIHTINTCHKNIDKLLIDDKNWTESVGDYLKEKKAIDSSPKNLDFNSDLFKYYDNELNEFLEVLQKGESLYFFAFPYLRIHPFNTSKIVGDSLYLLESRLRNDLLKYKRAIEEIDKLHLRFMHDARILMRKKYKDDFDNLSNELSEIQRLFDKNIGELDFMKTKGISKFFYQNLAILFPDKKGMLLDEKECLKRYSEVSKQLKKLDNTSYFPVSINKPIEIKNQLGGLESNLQSWFAKSKELINEKLVDIETSDFVNELSSYLELKEAYEKLIMTVNQADWFESVDADSSSIFIGLKNLKRKVDEAVYFIDNNMFAFEKLFEYCNFFNRQDYIKQELIEALHPFQNWKNECSLFYLNHLLIRNSKFKIFDKELYVELEDVFKKIGELQTKAILNQWLVEQRNLAKHFEQEFKFGVDSFFNTLKSGMKLREVIGKDVRLFQSFFPVVLTTPTVASTLFGDLIDQEKFDFVLFDEASQLRVQDTFPILLKGKQRIISGDEQQMPPSDEFKTKSFKYIKIKKGMTDVETQQIHFENNLLKSKSLIEFCSKLSFKNHTLNFHYRSQHPSLIEFSNKAFYNGKLHPSPSKIDDVPIEFEQVNGTYFESTNQAEADKIVEALIDLRRLKRKYPTVGIATFNNPQKTLIKKTIKLEKSRNRKFSLKMGELEKNGFFVKNLANIQGDERDFIFLSTSYGKIEGGNFTERIGSLNRPKGYQLLNVIITRAKLKMKIFTSIPPEVYLNYQNVLVDENKNRGLFYAYLVYAKAVNDGDFESMNQVLEVVSKLEISSKSDLWIGEDEEQLSFQTEVYNLIIKHLGKSKIRLNHKVAGYKMDIAILSEKKYEKSIVIECDGAKVHSSEEAYLHDLQREKILVEHGFKFKRIWSLDWWRNSEREFYDLIDFIRNEIDFKEDFLSQSRRDKFN